MELQQTVNYRKYIISLGWQVKPLNESAVFIKFIPFVGNFAKIQRCSKLPDAQDLINFIKKNKISRIAIEPDSSVAQENLVKLINSLKGIVKINKSCFLHTKTIFIDLSCNENQIFSRFSQAKRRAVRRAVKHGVAVNTKNDIKTLIKIKNKSAGLFGFITTTGISKMRRSFGKENTATLIAYHKSEGENPIAGVYVVFNKDKAYYWIAGSTKKGKKLFAPTLLVWKALKLAKKKRACTFDFVGIWDERLPNQNLVWKGFTRFKDGFGGKYHYYPLAN